jgi:hypothetical protein
MRLIQTTSSIERSGNSSVLAINEGTSILFAAALDAAAGGHAGGTARLLTGASAEVLAARGAPPSWPGRLASAISARLGEQRETGDPGWILFAAALVSQHAVHVCTAGDIRIHLVKDRRILRATRDHILANESPEWVQATYGDLDLDHHATMITRSLGNSALPPEQETWSVQAPFSVLACSSDYHGYRSPDLYCEQLLDATEHEDGSIQDAVLLRIDANV